MATFITAKSLFDAHRSKLDLKWIAGSSGAERHIELVESTTGRSPVTDISLVGHLNFIHPHRIQVLGAHEIDYLDQLNEESRLNALRQLIETNPLCVFIAEGLDARSDVVELCEKTGTPLISSTLHSQILVNHLQYYLSHVLAAKLTVHGVFMEVTGIGVLLTGASGVGKSELALELITRGHRLIADDSPEFSRVAPDTLNGRCPSPLKDFLEVRGLGVLNVRTMFGDSSIKDNKYLRLIIHLQQMADAQLREIDRLRGCREIRNVLGVDVPQVTLPVAPGRNLAVLVEIAVRNHILTLKGYNAADDFIGKQKEFVSRFER